MGIITLYGAKIKHKENSHINGFAFMEYFLP
jgi:hypothetical protein